MRSILESIKGTINYWWIFLSSGILFIITGIIVFRYPAESYFSLSAIFGALLFVVGVIRTVTAIASRLIARDWGWNLAFGIIEVIMGLILMTHPGITAVTLPFFFGFWLLLMGAYLVAFSFQFKDYNVSGVGLANVGRYSYSYSFCIGYFQSGSRRLYTDIVYWHFTPCCWFVLSHSGFSSVCDKKRS